MTRIKITLMALLAVFCMSAVVASAASANEGEFVNGSGEAVKGTATLKGKVTKLESSAGTIECKTNTGTATATNKTEGKLHVLFLECSSSVGKCQTAGETEGHITVLADWRTRRDSQPSGAVLLLVEPLNAAGELATEAKPLELKCGVITVKVWGSYLARIKPLGPPATNKFEFESTANGSHENTGEYETESEKGVKHKDVLHANFGLGWSVAAQVGSEEMTLEGTEKGEFK
jgi:hypothetical protein